MKNNFKLLILLFLVFSSSRSISQTKDLNFLVEKINNKEVYIVLLETVSPRIYGVAENEILLIGKDATESLISVLDSKNKGIIAHVLLSKIWKEKFSEDACCYFQSNGTTETVIINGLKIYIEDNILFATNEDLKKNKENWIKILES